MELSYGRTVAVLGAGTLLAYFFTYVAYNTWFHPLARFKGPTLWAAFRFPQVLAMLGGRLPYRIKELHDRYGDVVRTAPNELSFVDAAAWRDVYSHKEFIRPYEFRNRLPGKDADNFVSANVTDHARFRRIFGPAFSDQALRQQEPLIQSYVDKLMNALRRKIDEADSEQPATVNVVEWFNYTSFDIIGDLGWGKSFQCLEKGEYHPWITVVLHFKGVLLNAATKYYPPLNTILRSITPASAKAAIKLVVSTAEDNVRQRLSLGASSDRPDFMSYVLKSQNDPPSSEATSPPLSIEELECNSMALIVGGSDTLATALAGTVNCLLENPDSLRTLVREIRSSFTSEQEITSLSTKKSLPYLTAVLQEGLRMCPPFPDSLRRVIPQDGGSGGAIVAGNALSGGTVVSVACWAMFQSRTNFTSPSAFIPERWLPPTTPDGEDYERYKDDNHAAFHPFSVGPANCLGQNLAWMELRIILARLLYNFDIRVPAVPGGGEEGKTLRWTSQKIWWSWAKEPVRVTLTGA